MPPLKKLQLRNISKDDAALAQAAKKKAGGPAALARMFGVTLPAASEWGRARPIPRHVRPRLEDYVGLRREQATRPVQSGSEPLPAHWELQKRIHDSLQPDAAEVGKLPPRYRERYRERVKDLQSRVEAKLVEIAASVERELADFRARLMAEYRAQRRSLSHEDRR